MKLTHNTCLCMCNSSPPVTSSFHQTTANCNAVTVTPVCTQSHPVEFPLIVSERLCSRRSGEISKPRLLFCQRKISDSKLCKNCWLFSCLFTERPQIQQTEVAVCSVIVCKLHVQGCYFVCGMEKWLTLFYGLANFKINGVSRQRCKTVTFENNIWECFINWYRN